MAAAGVTADFVLPESLEAGEPPEARGLKRDEVRLLVSDVAAGSIEHARFHDLPRWLDPGDVLVVNTSATLNAALDVTGQDGSAFELHLSTHLPGNFWTVELRRPGVGASLPFRHAVAGAQFALPGGGGATLLAPYPFAGSTGSPARLWMAALHVPDEVPAYLEKYGFPIRYKYVKQAWPLSMYQTVFATEPGSAEMPSAGRPFTTELVTALVSRGVQVAPLLLHTGVASLEDHEPPYEEFFRVPRDTAARVNAAREAGHRVIAVGTTVIRALETMTDERPTTSPGEGWTNLVVSPERPVRSVDGLITGLHEPHATHLMMLEQVIAAARRERAGLGRADINEAPGRLLEHMYGAALSHKYLWHEFGDAHLIVASRKSLVALPPARPNRSPVH